MKKVSIDYQESANNPEKVFTPLEELCRAGARKLLQEAIDSEVSELIEKFKDLKNEQGNRLVVRNGHLPERNLMTGIGPIKVKQPRVRDARPGMSFTSSILPKYMRRVPSIDNLIPILYLKGISTGNFSEALESILGQNASGLSATNIVRLKEKWTKEYHSWHRRDMSNKHYVYLWVDGIYFNVRLEKDRPCILVIMGALENGQKELVAVHDGYRESKLSWKEVLRDLKKRGLSNLPKLATRDGALGFWAALREEFPHTREQRCWVHKTANILDKMPKSVQASAKSKIHDIYMANTKENALKAFKEFIRLYEAKYPKAVECLKKDKEVLFTFYDFPAEHWQHIRSTNPIESTFGTVRHRTRSTKGCGSRIATLTMVWKLALEAQKHWRKLRGHKLIYLVVQNRIFKDGELVKKAA